MHGDKSLVLSGSSFWKHIVLSYLEIFVSLERSWKHAYVSRYRQSWLMCLNLNDIQCALCTVRNHDFWTASNDMFILYILAVLGSTIYRGLKITFTYKLLLWNYLKQYKNHIHSIFLCSTNFHFFVTLGKTLNFRIILFFLIILHKSPLFLISHCIIVHFLILWFFSKSTLHVKFIKYRMNFRIFSLKCYFSLYL